MKQQPRWSCRAAPAGNSADFKSCRLAAAFPLHAPIALPGTQPQRCGRCRSPSPPASSPGQPGASLWPLSRCPCTAASEDAFCLPRAGLSWQLNTSPSANKGHYHARGLNIPGLLCPFHDNVKPQPRRKLRCSCGVSVVPSQPSCSASDSRRSKPTRLQRGELLSRLLQRYPLRDCHLWHWPRVLVLLKNTALSQQQGCEFRRFCRKKQSSPLCFARPLGPCWQSSPVPGSTGAGVDQSSIPAAEQTAGAVQPPLCASKPTALQNPLCYLL